MEEKRSSRECHQHTAPSNHRDNRDHRVGEGQGIEINPIGHAEEQRDENDVPAPLERCGLLTIGIPQREEHDRHDRQLVNIEPYLHRHHVEASHQMFVIQPAQCAHHDGEEHEEDPAVVGEANPLLPAREREQVERGQGAKHTGPLIAIQPLAKDQQSAQQCQHRLRSLDRPSQRKRQMLQGEIARDPRRKHNDGLHKDT